MSLKVAVFCHSLVSDWNHGNAHFLRGIVAELQETGHQVRVFEPESGWSRANLLHDHGPDALSDFERAFPHLASTTYPLDDLRVDEWLDGVHLAIVHEWNHPSLISALGRYRRYAPGLRLFFHDTHHRALTASHELAQFDLTDYDGVLVYGTSLKEAYRRRGWGSRLYVWHEAADVRTFYPRPSDTRSGDIVWIGNWGDEERTEELREFFINPVREAGFRAEVYGVRYPDSALQQLARASIRYKGWLPNYKVPDVFARFQATIHVPRRPYAKQLTGIPTIRPFEALACGIPLISAPWQDSENLFRVGTDFLMARNGDEMRRHLQDVVSDPQLAGSLAMKGLETVRSRHTCRHRVDELLHIYQDVRPAAPPSRHALVSTGVCQ